MTSLVASAIGRSRRSDGPELIGKVIDQRFRVLSLIGSGGMADVYEVEHVTLGRKLALKVLRHTAQSNPTLTRRFSREARALSRIASDHVVSIFDYGTLPEGFPFFVMELLRGRTLRAVLDEEHELTALRVCNLGIDVCLGLAATHQTGLVHRDLKPENLWLTRRDDGQEACILLDFGVAQDDGAHTTSEGVLVGTARYMSPEQIRSGDVPGPESDVFALGVVLYECLCGEAPFSADCLERTLFRILNEQPQPLAERVEDAPRELLDVVTRALEKQRSERFESAIAMARALLPFAGPFRQLHGLQPGTCSPSSGHTLADEDSTPSLRVKVDGLQRSEFRALVRQPWARGALILSVFLLGLATGGFALRKTPPTTAARKPAVAFSPSAATLRPPAVAAAVPLSSAPAANEPAAQAALSSPTSRPLHVRNPPKPSTSASAGTPELPARSGPPQPSFDGRNPYRP